MKHGRKLQRWMKNLLKSQGLNPNNWWYVKNEPRQLVIQNKRSFATEIIKLE